MILLYTITTFLTAFLLFMVQPMVARAWLPTLGGTPAVWNVCMVCFQTLLLLAYLYAHLLGKVRLRHLQLIIHLVIIWACGIISLSSLVDSPVSGTPTSPLTWLFSELLSTVALPFFMLATTSPLLQALLTQSDNKAAKNPYMLYVASNAGSLLALLAFPLVIERQWALGDQVKGWAALLLVAQIFLTAAISIGILRNRKFPIGEDPSTNDQSKQALPSNLTRLIWVLLAAIPSALLLAVTSHITTNVAAIPLFWVIPLALYLLTFMITFSEKVGVSFQTISRFTPLLFLALSPFLFLDVRAQPMISTLLHCLLFFVLGLLVHARLFDSRPSNRHITEFYLWLSFGGALGGIFVTLIAPIIFSGLYEYPLLILAALAARCLVKSDLTWISFSPFERSIIAVVCLYTFGIWFFGPFPESPLSLLLIYGLPALILFSVKQAPLPFLAGAICLFLNLLYYQGDPNEKVLLSARNFFGVKQVVRNESNQIIYLRHGTINHGSQSLLPERRLEPLSYFHRSGPVGDIFRAAGADSHKHVGIIGLGIGAMACYANPNQEFTLYEIDPLVVELARDQKYFKFLSDCPGQYKIELGDGRLEVAKASEGYYSPLFLDAFSSDAVPVHLITLEALKLYLKKLAPDGILIFNISNQYLDFRPLLAGAAKELGLVMKYRDDRNVSPQEQELGKLASMFAVLARDERDFGAINDLPAWQTHNGPTITPWSDSYSNLLSLMQ